MALRIILQLGVVFAIGSCWGPAPLSAGAVSSAPDDKLPLSIQLKDPEDVIVVKGQSATLRCQVETPGNEPIKISWLHNDRPLPENDTRRHLQIDGSLYFPKVTGGKKGGITGEYRCHAANVHGSVLSNPAKLMVASFDRDFSRQPSSPTVLESQPAVLFCSIHSIPAAQIKWEHNTVPLPHSTKYVPLPSGALLITRTHSSDAGSYRCIATNNLLKKTKHSKIVELTVISTADKPTEPAVAPTILPLDILPNTTVLVGENVNLYCAVTGWPIPTVQWLNNNSIVISNSSILTIHDVRLRDTGNYTCTAYNSGGRLTQRYNLVVEQKPYFNITPTSKTYPPAKTVRLDCQALGVPEPKIHWLKNGVPLLIDELRIKKQSTGLVFSHTFSYDSGIYQCIAVNSVGKVWAAAQLALFVDHTPSPPENVQCRPYDNTSICLTWRNPENVSAQAYSIYSFYSAMGPEISGPEFVTNVTYELASGLHPSTNYTFYVRLYSNIASDQSMKVTCGTGAIGRRDLKVTPENETTVDLTWSKISTDVPCRNQPQVKYNVQWKRKGSFGINTANTSLLTYRVTGLIPHYEYEFRVTSALVKVSDFVGGWISYGRSGVGEDHGDESIHGNGSKYDSGNSTDLIPIPENLEVTAISANVVNLTWNDLGQNIKFYVVCYTDLNNFEEFSSDCEETNLIRSSENSLQVDRLHANTVYEFKVRAHNSEGYFSPFSQSVEVRTPTDVPSPIINLTYKVVNETAACIRWQTPPNKKLSKYLISYTPDTSWHLHQWMNKSVSVPQKKSKGCWMSGRDEAGFSALLLDLNPKKQYTVLVRADSDTEPGKLVILSTGKVVKTEGDGDNTPELQNTINNNQKIGIISGVIVAVIVIMVCIACIYARKQCLKTQARARARMAASNDYYPAVARYATEDSSVQVRLENRCSSEIHETEHLVSEERPPHIPTVTPIHLDTKGGDGFPNGHINGSAKPFMNGHLPNGNVHITENPRFYAHECNGHAGKRPSHEDDFCPPYEEDSNSNLKTSKFQDLHRLFESSKQRTPSISSSEPSKHQQNKSKYQCNPHFRRPHETDGLMDGSNSKNSSQASLSGDEGDGSLNSTQLTCLDMSVNNHRRISPILGPNG